MQLDEWLRALPGEIGIPDMVLDAASVNSLLDVTRDAAHEVERVAGPLTTFLMGVAVGRGQPLADVVTRTTALAIGNPSNGVPGGHEPADRTP
jgi:hypothetical protein